MSTVRFVTICDKCGARSEEYSAWASCVDCLEDVCERCDVPGMRTADESNGTQCRDCARGLNLVMDQIYTTEQMQAAMAFTMGIMEHPERLEIGEVRFL